MVGSQFLPVLTLGLTAILYPPGALGQVLPPAPSPPQVPAPSPPQVPAVPAVPTPVPGQPTPAPKLPTAAPTPNPVQKNPAVPPAIPPGQDVPGQPVTPAPTPNAGVVPAPPITDSWNVRGVNLGGLFVLEPWVNPSLFWQFENKPPEKTAIDTYTFCQVLGPKEANKQLRAFWKRFVSEKDFKKLAETGINSVRLVVGDWMYIPHGAFEGGCFDGSLDMVDQLIKWAAKYKIGVWMDLHSTKGGQNGWDHSGQARDVKWVGVGLYEKVANPSWLLVADDSPEEMYMLYSNTSATQWPRAEHYKVGKPSEENVQHTLDVLEAMGKRHGSNPGVVGIMDVINEPIWTTPIPALKEFYAKAEKVLTTVAPKWKRAYHDSFQGYVDVWGGANGLPGPPSQVTLDSHIYFGFSEPFDTVNKTFQLICEAGEKIAKFRKAGIRNLIGEWSLAMDSCNMWLAGWHGVGKNAELHECSVRKCQGCSPAVPEVLDAVISGGRGATKDCFCSTTRLLPDGLVKELTRRQLSAWSKGDGYMFWNFKTESMDPYWDFFNAHRLGYLPKDLSKVQDYANACDKPCVDTPEYKCSDIVNKLSGYVGIDLGGNPVKSLELVSQGKPMPADDDEGTKKSSAYLPGRDDALKTGVFAVLFSLFIALGRVM